MHQPLAMRMRPTTIDQIVGQNAITHKDSILWKMVENDVLTSLILYGPPGTGKTSIANVIALHTKADFIKINAVADKKDDLVKAVKKAQESLKDDKRTIVFIDEIHRFNKTQQDYLLPYVEDGTIILIGATTENPYFEVNNALVSRSHILKLEPITKEDILKVLDRAMSDPDGLDMTGKTIDADVLDLIADRANGDIRYALSLLEQAYVITDNITSDTIKDIIQQPNLLYDKDGDKHYDTISAFIKSMRGSDPDAVLYYLARMITAGEDPKFIARRIFIHASEDVGNADPMAICVAASAMYAVTTIGLPEAAINLAQAALYVAMAPKSNAAAAGIEEALRYVHSHPSNDVPLHLRDAHYKHAKDLGHGVDYKYPHDFPGHWVWQEYLPDSVHEQFYHPSKLGHEAEQIDYQNSIRNLHKNSPPNQD